MVKKQNNMQDIKHLKIDRTDKVPTKLLQNTFENTGNGYDDVTSLFPNNYLEPFILDGTDLINESSLHIKDVIEQLYKVLKMQIGTKTLLDTLYALIINNQHITSFHKQDKSKLAKKAYLCILNYIIIMRFSHIIKKIIPQADKEILLIHTSVVSLFTKSNEIINFFKIEEINYSPHVILCLENSTKVLNSFMGQSFSFMRNIRSLIAKHNLEPSILSFTEYATHFWFSNPLTVKKNKDTNSISIDSVYITDIDFLCYVMREEIPHTFLSEMEAKDKLNMKKSITKLKDNFVTLFYLNYLHIVYQLPNMAALPAHGLFTKIAKTTSIRIPHNKLETFFAQTQLSKNLFSSLTKILSDATTSLVLVLALSLDQNNFSSGYLKFDPINLESNFEILKATALKRGNTLIELHKNDITLSTVDSNITTTESPKDPISEDSNTNKDSD